MASVYLHLFDFDTIEPRLDWPECYPGFDHQQFIATTANRTRLRCIKFPCVGWLASFCQLPCAKAESRPAEELA